VEERDHQPQHYLGTGEVVLSFPVPAGCLVDRPRSEVRKHLESGSRSSPKTHVSRVINISEAASAIIELTVNAKTQSA
jgi:hypothetical protein